MCAFCNHLSIGPELVATRYEISLLEEFSRAIRDGAIDMFEIPSVDELDTVGLTYYCTYCERHFIFNPRQQAMRWEDQI